jgi:hypothetical protein
VKFIDTLKKYGDSSLGYPSEKTLQKMYEISPDLDQLMDDLLFTPQRSIVPPLHHNPTDEKNYYIAVPEKYVPMVQTMVANRYAKTYSIRQIAEKLNKLGYNIDSNGKLTSAWNRAEKKLGLKEVPKKEPKKKRQPLTEARKKQLSDARAIAAKKKRLESLKKEMDKERRNLAYHAAKSGKTAREVMKEPESPKAKARKGLINTIDEKALEETKERLQKENKKVIYEPTPKQAEFHAAGEDVVLYGGAAG